MKKLTAVFILFIVFVLAFVLPASAANPTLSAKLPDTAKTGTYFDVEVSLSNNPGFNGLQVTAEYDRTVLALENYENGNIFKTVITTSQTKSVVPYEIMWITSDVNFADITENGKIVTYTFKVLDNAALGDTTLKFSIASFSDNANTKDYDFVDSEVKIKIKKGSTSSSAVFSETKSKTSGTISSTSSSEKNNTAVISETETTSKNKTSIVSKTEITSSNNPEKILNQSSVEDSDLQNSKEQTTSSKNFENNAVHNDIFYPILAVIMIAVVALIIISVVITKKKKSK